MTGKPEHAWETLHEVREISTDGYVAGDVGTEHTGPYRVLYCPGGECCEGQKKIEPFTPEELVIDEVLENVRETALSGVTKIVPAPLEAGPDQEEPS